MFLFLIEKTVGVKDKGELEEVNRLFNSSI